MRKFRPFSLHTLIPRHSFYSSSSFSSYLFPQKPLSSSSSSSTLENPLTFHIHSTLIHPFYSPTLHYFSSTSNPPQHSNEQSQYETEDDSEIEEWEEEDETDPEIGDGGAGGGIALQNVPWGEQALSFAQEVLLQFDDDLKLFSFKTTPRGYIYVRLDKLSNEYGCPSMEDIESYSRQYKKRLEEEGSKGHIPDDLALEVSSPGAERLLRVPDDLHRFRDFPMVVAYVEEDKPQQKNGVFLLDSIEKETQHCVWRLANVKENRDPAAKGRPLNRKQKDWRLKLPYSTLKSVTLYLES